MEFNEFLILDHRANYSDMIFPSAVASHLQRWFRHLTEASGNLNLDSSCCRSTGRFWVLWDVPGLNLYRAIRADPLCPTAMPIESRRNTSHLPSSGGTLPG